MIAVQKRYYELEGMTSFALCSIKYGRPLLYFTVLGPLCSILHGFFFLLFAQYFLSIIDILFILYNFEFNFLNQHFQVIFDNEQMNLTCTGELDIRTLLVVPTDCAGNHFVIICSFFFFGKDDAKWRIINKSLVG